VRGVGTNAYPYRDPHLRMVGLVVGEAVGGAAGGIGGDEAERSI
jgi:hypothetical protein